jgi:hypothetical protein
MIIHLFSVSVKAVPARRDSASARPSVRGDANTEAAVVDPIPDWFSQFLNDRQTRKPSAHTMKAYRQVSSRSRRWSEAAIRHVSR